MGPRSSPRPIVGFLILYAALFVLYAMGVAVAFRSKLPTKAIKFIWLYGLLARVIFVPSVPILEIDIYRYMWDGAACRIGVDPYAYSPLEVEQADARQTLPPDLRKLVLLRDSDTGNRVILERIHYEQFTTIYPPVSQCVFALASFTTPQSASPAHHLFVMKLWLTLFDIGTFALVIGMLRELNLPLVWALGYGWCPLVLKEIAGSGHLDSIAVFWSTFAVFALLRFVNASSKGDNFDARRVQLWLAVTIVTFALAVAAKLYPVVLAPVFLGTVVRVMGWPKGIAAGCLAIGLSLVLLWPMLGHALMPRSKAGQTNSPPNNTSLPNTSTPNTSTPNTSTPITATLNTPTLDTAPFNMAEPNLPFDPQAAPSLGQSASGVGSETGLTEVPLPEQKEATGSAAAESGLQAFVSTWEMNDLVFMVLVENLRPTAEGEAAIRPWFVFVPNVAREALYGHEQDRRDVNRQSFRHARFITLTLVMAFGVVVLIRQSRNAIATSIIRDAFLLLAIFWITSPTQNPWYWIWCLPFLFVMRNPGWWLVSGVVGIYYLRFWLTEVFVPEEPILGGYPPEWFFHFVVVPFEHSLWIAALIGWRTWRRTTQSQGESTTRTVGQRTEVSSSLA